MNKFKSIKTQFLSGITVNNIDFKEISTNLEWDLQEDFVNKTILDERNQNNPLRKEYQVSFIKHVIKTLEENGTTEIHDKFYEALADKIKEADAEFSFKHFKIIDNEYISVKESNSFIRDGTTGLKLWPAAVTLSNYIIQHRNLFHEKSILELGSGCTGLVGLTLLKSSKCRQISLSDCHDIVLNNLIENVDLNLKGYDVENLDSSLLIRHHLTINKACEFGILNLPWEEIEDNRNELLNTCHIDIILAADIVYDSSIFEALIKCLTTLFEIYYDSSLQFILSQTIRNYETFENFCKNLRENAFIVTEISLDKLECQIPNSNDPLNCIKMFKITRTSTK